MKGPALIAAMFCICATVSHAQPVPIEPDSGAWTSPPGLPDVQGTWVVGSENRAGVYVFRVRMAGGAKLPPHTHPDERITTVVRGTLYVGFGDTFDESKMAAIEAGKLYVAPANMSHYLWAKDGAVVYHESGLAPTATRIIRKN